MKSVVNNSFVVFTCGVVGLFLLPSLFQEGMFMDGLIYATVAHNMYLGIGDIWDPQFSQTYMHQFAEHPTLAMWLQSIFYHVLGDYLLIDKLYSVVIGVCNFLVLVLLWKSSVPIEKKKIYWWPAFLFIMVPSISWAFTNNMLENTMGLFSMVSTFVLFKSIHRKLRTRMLLIIGAAFIILASFLSKGFPGLYPLGFFVVYYVVYFKEFKFNEMALNSVLLVFSFVTITVLFLYFNDEAFAQLTRYFDKQVLKSLEGKLVVGNRWHIVGVLGSKIIIAVLIVVSVALAAYKKNVKLLFNNSATNKLAILFLLIGVSASAPIMVSPKQLDFYIVPSIPFYVLALAVISAEPLWLLIERIKENQKGFIAFKFLGWSLIVLTIVLTISGVGGYSRDKNMIQDVDSIGSYLGSSEIISISKKHGSEWSLYGYFQRKYGVGFLIESKNSKYLLRDKEESRPNGYTLVPLPTNNLVLYEIETEN